MAYNAALEIIKAFELGRKGRVDEETKKAHAQILKDQLAETTAEHKRQEARRDAEHKLAKSIAEIGNLHKMGEMMSKGQINVPTYQKPTDVVSGGQTQYGTQQVGGMESAVPVAPTPQNNAPLPVTGQMPTAPPQQMLDAAPAMQAPVTGMAPQMQTEASVVPGTVIAGVDLSNSAAPQQMMKTALDNKVKEAGAVASAQETAKDPARQKEFENKKELQGNQLDFNREALDRNLEYKGAHDKVQMEIAKARDAATSEYRKSQLALSARRVGIAAAKLAAAAENNDYSSVVDDARKGALSLEKIKTLVPTTAAQKRVMEQIRSRGVLPLKEEQIQKLGDLQIVRSFYEEVQQLNAEIAQHKGTDIALSPTLRSNLEKRRETLLAQLEPLAKSFGYKGAVTKDEQELLKTYVPSYFGVDVDKNNKTAESKLRRFLDTKIKTVVPPGSFTGDTREMQYHDILQNYNLHLPKEAK